MKKTFMLFLAAMLISVCAVTAGAADPELVTWSFEDGTIAPFVTADDWGKVTLICARDTDRNDGVTPVEKDGTYFLNTVFREDDYAATETPTGTIVSPIFEIHDPIVTCLIAGGAPDNYVAVCRASDDTELATGVNILGSGHVFIECEIDLGDNYKKGEEVYFKIVDGTTSNWGFISVDKIQFTGIVTDKLPIELPEPEVETVETEPAVETVLTFPGEPAEILWSFEDGVLDPFTTEDDWEDVTLICARDTDRNDGVTDVEKDGTYFLNTVFLEDDHAYNEYPTGSIKSPVFKIYDPIVTCLIAGGAPENYVAVCRASDDTELATGINILGSGHVFIDCELDLGDNYVEGEEVYFKIVDGKTSSWGFISVDKIQAKGIVSVPVPVETEAPETEAPETEAPETEAPETEAPETEAPETEAPETEAPETEAPETEAPETEATKTEEVVNAPQTFDAGVIAAAAAIVSAAGYALSKKRG